MIGKALAAAIATAAMGVPAMAETLAPAANVVRYSFSKVSDGILRLDPLTGEVALCSRQPTGWACLAAPDERAALEVEIMGLRRQNGLLKSELLAHDLPLPAGMAPERDAAAGNADPGGRAPGSGEVRRVIVFFGRVWHRLVEAIADAHDRLVHKS